MQNFSETEQAERRKRGLELLQSPPSEALEVSVLSTFNLDLLPPFLAEAMARLVRPAAVGTSDFGQMAQEVLDPGSRLYQDEPDAVVLVPAVEDLLAPLFSAPPSELDADGIAAMVSARSDELHSLVETILARLPGATCYVVVFGPSGAPLEAVLGPRARERGQDAVEALLHAVRGLGELSPRAVVVDWDWHARTRGTAAFSDERLWYLARMRLNLDGCAELSELIARHAAAVAGATKKVAVVDLDGTLWGGVIGEGGVQGIELGEEGTGLAFQDFQRELKKLKDAGVVLAMATKNNPADAIEAFERHPGMVLSRDDFASERIDWRDKATNIREIAAELNLGLDSFVFLDDNPVEREWLRQALPMVTVPDLPEDPASRPMFLRRLPYFNRIALTDADRGRSADYRAQGSRQRLAADLPSFEDFLASLEQRVSFDPVDDGSLSRATQLCQRTNQFNLTTRRHGAADLEQMLAAGDHELWTLALEDRFGDSGITGLAILQHHGDDVLIDTLLLSCRVLGRHVEDAFLAFLAERARERGARRLIGTYLPTAKNAQTADFYPDRGFEAIGEGSFAFDLTQARIEYPEQLEVKVGANA